MAVGNLYVQCSQRGELVTLGQPDAADVSRCCLQAALDRFGRPAVDSFRPLARSDELRDALDKAGVPGAELVVRGQGIQGRRPKMFDRIPTGLGRWPRDAATVAAAAIGDERSAHDLRSGWQREAIQSHARRATLAGKG